MDRKEAIEVLKKNKPTSDPRRCGIELCEAVDMAIKALQENHRCDNCSNGENAGVRIYCLLHTSFHRLDEYCSEWEEDNG